MSSFVYVISGRYQKIGHSRSPKTRLDQFKTASPYKLEIAFTLECPYAERVERKAHTMLAEHRLNGEWFDVPPAMAIEAVKSALAVVAEEMAIAQAHVVPLRPEPPPADADARALHRCLSLLQRVQWEAAEHYDELHELMLPSDLEAAIIDMMNAHSLRLWDSAGVPEPKTAFDDGWGPEREAK